VTFKHCDSVQMVLAHEHVTRFHDVVYESNRQGRDGWQRFGPHRDRLQGLLRGCADARASLGVLGAGNLNDLRLEELLDLYAEVHLVDLDVGAVRSALARRGLVDRPDCRVHGPVDLTGILDHLPAPGTPPAPQAANVLVETLASQGCVIPAAPFDVTVSAAALTQLLQSVVDSALPRADAVRVSLALRDKHVRDLVSLTRPNGKLVLVTDFVSTTTAPELAHTGAEHLEAAMAHLVVAKNFFTGTNPYRVLALLEEDPRVTSARLVDPWLWAVTPDREHLAYAIVARRHPSAPSLQ
jgi:hypothetical protein